MDLEPFSIPAVSEGVVVVATEDLGGPSGFIVALDAATGREVWRRKIKEENSSPIIHEGKVIFGDGDFKVRALDLHTGEQEWAGAVEGRFAYWVTPAIAFGDVFMADRTGNIFRLDGRNGKLKWIFRDTIGTMDQSSPVVAGNSVFIGSGAGWLYALDAHTGRLQWKENHGGHILSGAADSERFYFGSKLTKEGLYAYEHDPNGKLAAPPVKPNVARDVIGGIGLFVLIVGGVILLGRRRRRHTPA